MNPDLRVGGSWRSITRSEVYLGGSWRTLTRGEIYKGAAWHPMFTFVSPLTASVSPSSADGSVSSITTALVTSNIVTVTPSGGLGPYTYSVTAPGVSVSGPTNAASSFSATLAPGHSISTTADWIVTDSIGSTSGVSVPVYLENTG